MPAGVEGFVPGRLTMAREARALRQAELANLVGKSPATISKYENVSQPQRPDAGILPHLAEVLKVDVSWFFKPLRSHAETAVFYRSMSGELELMRTKARARLGFVENIETTLSSYVDLPELDVPDLLQGRDYRTLRREDFDIYASALREHWGLGDDPIDDLLLVIENAGIVVAEDELGSEKLDGVSWWSSATARPYMLVARDKNIAVRRRFDAAHEMAHIVLHRSVSPEELKQDFRLIEEQAMAFSGAFLLPGDHFSNDVYSVSLETLLAIKPKWKVSIGDMIKRLSSLGLISDLYERRLWQYYSYRRWRKGEPLDDRLPVEQPQNLRASIDILVREGILSKREIIQNTGLSASDVVSLTGLPADFFSDEPKNILRLKPSVKQGPDQSDVHVEGNVISFLERRGK